MNALVRRFLYEESNFEEVVVLSEGPPKDWNEVANFFPNFPKGWFELSRVASEDRIEFIRIFWEQTLPFQPKAHRSISDFFNALDDIGVVLSKSKDSWQAQLVYSLNDNSSFFRGLEPASAEEIDELKLELEVACPRDWVAFTKIHNGFGKLSEIDLILASEISEKKRKLRDIILNATEQVKSGKVVVDPDSLIPFFEASGLSSFQCFYSDWYPADEMGNVYFSGIDYTVSDLTLREMWNDNGAFTTFLEWLSKYLSGTEMCI